MFTHDLIKILYSSQGFLPDYPYHMMSDEEMFDAFINYKGLNDEDTKSRYFDFNYPNLLASTAEYEDLKKSIIYHINRLIDRTDQTVLPDWVYSYMAGSAIGLNNPKLDIHDLAVLLGTDNIDDDFDAKTSEACLEESRLWISETHTPQLIVLRYKRVNHAEEVVTLIPTQKVTLSDNTEIEAQFVTAGMDVYLNGVLTHINTVSTTDVENGVPLRPPTMFGEPHVIKSLRLKAADPLNGVGRLKTV